jgi:hypothetical protein
MGSFLCNINPKLCQDRKIAALMVINLGKEMNFFMCEAPFIKHLVRSTGKNFVLDKKRRHPDSNWGIKDLQSSALPLGYAAIIYIDIIPKIK